MALREFTLPPGPAAPAWDQARGWIEDPIRFWNECRNEFGPTFTVQLGSLGTTVLFSQPEPVRCIFGLDRGSYSCREYNEHYRLIMGDNSLLVLDGQGHWTERTRLGPAFVPAASNDWIGSLRRLAARELRRLNVDAGLHPRRFAHAVVFESMLQLLFGEGHDELQSLLRNVIMKDVVKDYGTWSPWARFSKWHPVLRKFIEAEAVKQQACNGNGTPTTHGVFARLARETGQQDAEHTFAQLEDHVFTILIAGVDPTMLTMAWAIHWVWSTPPILQLLQDELRSANDPNRWIKESQLLDATVREVLRMVPVVTTPSGRKLLRSAEIDGRRYPNGVTLLPCTYLVHRCAALYPEPDRFIPQRFLHRAYRSYEYFPFGGGQRICPGARLAQLTVKAVLTELLLSVDMEPASDGEVRPVRHGTLLAPSDNLQMRLLEVRRPPEPMGADVTSGST